MVLKKFQSHCMAIRPTRYVKQGYGRRFSPKYNIYVAVSDRNSFITVLTSPELVYSPPPPHPPPPP